MPQSIDLESEQFMTLLTDALRAGPGSPEWHQAVGVLRSSRAANADEYQLLITARQNLESGINYRAVKAGPGFTRKVLEQVDEEGKSAAKGIPSANLVALFAAGVILAVVVVIAVVLLNSNAPDAGKEHLEQLRSVFTTSITQTNFDSATEVGPDWKTVGEVPLKFAKDNAGLRPATTQPTDQDKREYRAGAIVKAESIPPDQPRLFEVSFKLKNATDAIIPQVFISEGPLDEKAASGKELVWLMKAGQAQLALPDLSVPSQGEKLNLKSPQTVTVKIRFNKDSVIVDLGDKRIYEGPHKLSSTAPRYIGVRFLRKVGDNTEGTSLSAISVYKP